MCDARPAGVGPRGLGEQPSWWTGTASATHRFRVRRATEPARGPGSRGGAVRAPVLCPSPPESPRPHECYRAPSRRRRPSAASDHVHGRGDPRAWAAGAGAGGGALASPPLISSPPQGPAATTQAPRKGNGTRPAPVSAQGPRTGGAKTPAASPSVFTSDWAASRVAAGFADEFGTPAGRGRARGRVAVATRFWGTDAAATDRLDEFLGAAEQVGDIVLVGVRAEEDRVDTMGHLRRRNRSRTTGIAIQPWLGPAHTVNVLTEIAARLGAEFLLLWSVDVSLAPADAHCLLRLAAATDHAAAVVGGALPHHVFAEGTHKLLGAAAPWNTLSVWHVPTLVRCNVAALPVLPSAPVGGQPRGRLLLTARRARRPRRSRPASSSPATA